LEVAIPQDEEKNPKSKVGGKAHRYGKSSKKQTLKKKTQNPTGESYGGQQVDRMVHFQGKENVHNRGKKESGGLNVCAKERILGYKANRCRGVKKGERKEPRGTVNDGCKQKIGTSLSIGRTKVTAKSCVGQKCVSVWVRNPKKVSGGHRTGDLKRGGENPDYEPAALFKKRKGGVVVS